MKKPANWIPKEDELIYYKDSSGATIPGSVFEVFKSEKSYRIKVRLNHPDYLRDIFRIVQLKNLYPQSINP